MDFELADLTDLGRISLFFLHVHFISLVTCLGRDIFISLYYVLLREARDTIVSTAIFPKTECWAYSALLMIFQPTLSPSSELLSQPRFVHMGRF